MTTTPFVVQLTDDQLTRLRESAMSLSIPLNDDCVQAVLVTLVDAHHADWVEETEARQALPFGSLEEALRGVMEPQVQREFSFAPQPGPIAQAMSTKELWERLARDYKGNQFVTRIEEMDDAVKEHWQKAFALTWANVGIVDNEAKWVLVERAARALVRQSQVANGD